MQTAIVAAISSIIGAGITAIANYFITVRKTDSAEENTYYGRLDKRVKHLEKEYDELKAKVNLWTSRYWGLHYWLVRFCMLNGISQTPPKFHQMSAEEIANTEFKESYESSEKNK
ncbi:hypothetical protein LX73_2341 [Fodinibius salinus]|uniref:Uncharacterized protein n=1 Tax=Fodinibius salinus TaxID=860790 RepID=A0A5D3YGF9_9BACT|nr:hypothetical protein [Fodinibius salinus]TYP92093.1 hypothetical protein LX73_2341 [Fodinibius salinus]